MPRGTDCQDDARTGDQTRQDQIMKTSNQLLLLGMLSALPVTVPVADAARPDTSKWECKSCPVEQGWSGSVDVGAGNVSDKSAAFGEYNGLFRNGGFLVGDGAMQFRGPDAYYWNIYASDLGLDTRKLNAEGGRQGRYKLLLGYEQFAHRISDTSMTPFLGVGGASLTLPPGFPGATTAAMPLAASLQRMEINQDRKRSMIGASWMPANNWEYSFNYRHETRDATKRIAGSFFVYAARLIEPVEYHTDQMDIAASYTGGRLQAKLAYSVARFRNDNDALTWQNPFAVPAAPGALSGQLALAPDNQFHQVLASAGYQFSERTRVSADIAWGRMTQNQAFPASTLNAGLAVPALPASSLDGRADTLDANLKLTSALTQRLRLSAIFVHNERDNQTPRNSYPSVSTDMFLGIPRTNLPYSFTDDKLKLSADYRLTARTKLAAGYDQDRRKRTLQEVGTTDEDTVWGKISTRFTDKVDMTLKLAHGERKGSNYEPVPGGVRPPENPLLRKYYMANRDRDSAGLRIDFAATDAINVGFGAESSKDDYSDSAIGLTSGRDRSLNADVTWIVTEQTSLHLFANREEIKSTQRGSQAFSIPDWTGENKDTIDTVGIGVKHAAIKDKLDIGADYMVSRAKRDIKVETGAANPAFPTVSASVDSLKLYADYRLKDNVSLVGSYWYEDFDSSNWMLEGVAAGTIPNVLTFGEQTPRYR
ncbi:MAG: hypothetical protein A3G25_11840, partial [Betaproteobacteria bacterium RIFCSPLOWO2_12_FULL_63_13]